MCNLYLHTTTHTSIVAIREDTAKLNCGYIDLKINIRQNWNNKDIEKEKKTQKQQAIINLFHVKKE